MTKKAKFGLILLVILALGLRTYKLVDFPYGFHFDEAKVAWNALSLGLTGHDDHGNFLPWYYDSFGDFRPTGIFYLTIPFILAMGRNIWAVRLPAAIFGALTVVPVFFLGKELSGEKKKNHLGWWAAFFLAINPWHISVSRATSEVVISLLFSSLGLYFFVRTIKTNSWKYMILALGGLLSAFAFYHSIRIMAPILAIAAITYYWWAYGKKYHFKWAMVATMVLITVTTMTMLAPQARGRLSQVAISSDFAITYETQKMPAEEGPNQVLMARTFHNRYAVMLRRLAEEYFSYLSGDFLVGQTAKPIRYMTSHFGLITYTEFLLLLLGIAAAVIKKDLRLVWLWLLLAPIPAAATIEDVPNLHRSMLMVPFMVILEAGGMSLLWESKQKILVILALIGVGGHFMYYLHFYYNHGNFALSAYYRDGGMVELAQWVKENRNKYDEIVMTNYTDNPYPWIAFFDGFDPHDFNNHYQATGELGYTYQNLVFSNQKCPSARAFKQFAGKHIAVINGEGCDYTGKGEAVLTAQIDRKDESHPFSIWSEKDQIY